MNINEKFYRKLFRPLSFYKHFIIADKIHFNSFCVAIWVKVNLFCNSPSSVGIFWGILVWGSRAQGGTTDTFVVIGEELIDPTFFYYNV